MSDHSDNSENIVKNERDIVNKPKLSISLLIFFVLAGLLLMLGYLIFG